MLVRVITRALALAKGRARQSIAALVTPLRASLL